MIVVLCCGWRGLERGHSCGVSSKKHTQNETQTPRKGGRGDQSQCATHINTLTQDAVVCVCVCFCARLHAVFASRSRSFRLESSSEAKLFTRKQTAAPKGGTDYRLKSLMIESKKKQQETTDARTTCGEAAPSVRFLPLLQASGTDPISLRSKSDRGAAVGGRYSW